MLFSERREQNEGREQEEDNVDERDDLNARLFRTGTLILVPCMVGAAVTRTRQQRVSWRVLFAPGLDVDLGEAGLASFVEDVDRLGEKGLLITVDQDASIRVLALNCCRRCRNSSSVTRS